MSQTEVSSQSVRSIPLIDSDALLAVANADIHKQEWDPQVLVELLLAANCRRWHFLMVGSSCRADLLLSKNVIRSDTRLVP